jgi:hypothetical protein
MSLYTDGRSAARRLDRRFSGKPGGHDRRGPLRAVAAPNRSESQEAHMAQEVEIFGKST